MSEIPGLTEVRNDPWGDPYTEVWKCDVPPAGVSYQVVRAAWSDNFTVRTILEIKLLGA